MRRLHQLSSKHLRLLIQKLQSTEKTMRSMRISEKDLTSLQKMQGTLWPFIEDFKKTAHALRRKAMQVTVWLMQQGRSSEGILEKLLGLPHMLWLLGCVSTYCGSPSLESIHTVKSRVQIEDRFAPLH